MLNHNHSIIPEKCRGCNHFMKRIKECSFTHHGVIYLEECLCSECLIKPICEIVCNPLRKQVGSIDNDLHELAREFSKQIAKRI